MGIYYCDGFDWCFNTKPIASAADLAMSISQDPECAAYCTDHWHELMDRYEPSVMWGLVRLPGMRTLADRVVSRDFLDDASPAPNLHSDITTREYSSTFSVA